MLCQTNYQISEKEWNEVQQRFKEKTSRICSLETQLEEQIQLNERLQSALENSEKEIQDLMKSQESFKKLESLYLETINSLKCKLYTVNSLKNTLTSKDLLDE